MANVSKHNTEQKRKSDYIEYSRVDLFVLGNRIGVSDSLERLSQNVQLKVSRRLDLFCVEFKLDYFKSLEILILNKLVNFLFQAILFFCRNPNSTLEIIVSDRKLI